MISFSYQLTLWFLVGCWNGHSKRRGDQQIAQSNKNNLPLFFLSFCFSCEGGVGFKHWLPPGLFVVLFFFTGWLYAFSSCRICSQKGEWEWQGLLIIECLVSLPCLVETQWLFHQREDYQREKLKKHLPPRGACPTTKERRWLPSSVRWTEPSGRSCERFRLCRSSQAWEARACPRKTSVKWWA